MNKKTTFATAAAAFPLAAIGLWRIWARGGDYWLIMLAAVVAALVPILLWVWRHGKSFGGERLAELRQRPHLALLQGYITWTHLGQKDDALSALRRKRAILVLEDRLEIHDVSKKPTEPSVVLPKNQITSITCAELPWAGQAYIALIIATHQTAYATVLMTDPQKGLMAVGGQPTFEIAANLNAWLLN